MIKKDILFLAEAIKEADRSQDPVNNKMVGCVIVKKGVIIGRGFRNLFIINDRPHLDICFHAEHIALMEAGIHSKGSTLYCTMEPCNKRHRGLWNTVEPPLSCTDLIINSGVERVVYLETDDGEGFGGAGVMKEKGIKVDKISLS